MDSFVKDNSKKITFQQYHIDYYVSTASPSSCVKSENQGFESVVCFFGRIDEDHSICCHVHGFKPSITVLLDLKITPSQCSVLRRILNDSICESQMVGIHGFDPVTEINIISESLEERSPNCHQDMSTVEIMTAKPSLLPIVKKHIDDWKIRLPGHPSLRPTVTTKTTNFVKMFQQELEANAFSWMEIDAMKYVLRSQVEAISTCHLEIDVNVENLTVKSFPAGSAFQIIPFTILSFDIECECYNKVFPKPKVSQILQISNVVMRFGDTEPILKTVFTLNTCAPIPGSSIFSYSTEKEMLVAWLDFVTRTDPDIITGHNIVNFDIYFLIERFNHINAENLFNLGRIKNSKTTWCVADYKSNRMHWRQDKFCVLEGRLILDVMLRVAVECDFRNCTLNFLSNLFLNELKEDVKIEEIMTLQNGDETSRQRLAEYCLKDSLLAIGIVIKEDMLSNYIRTSLKKNILLFDILNSSDKDTICKNSDEKPFSLWKISGNVKSPNAETDKTLDGCVVNNETNGSKRSTLGMRRKQETTTDTKSEGGSDAVMRKGADCYMKPRPRRFGLSRPKK